MCARSSRRRRGRRTHRRRGLRVFKYGKPVVREHVEFADNAYGLQIIEARQARTEVDFLTLLSVHATGDLLGEQLAQKRHQFLLPVIRDKRVHEAVQRVCERLGTLETLLGRARERLVDDLHQRFGHVRALASQVRNLGCAHPLKGRKVG